MQIYLTQMNEIVKHSEKLSTYVYFYGSIHISTSTTKCKNSCVLFFTSPTLLLTPFCAQKKLHTGSLQHAQNSTVWKS